MGQPTVAIVGASADRSKFGNKSVRAHLASGYTVFPVNPKGGEVEGISAYTSLADIPVPLDRISMYVSPKVGVTMLDQIAATGCGELWLNPGTESDELVKGAVERGITLRIGCSIVDLGVSPGQFPD